MSNKSCLLLNSHFSFSWCRVCAFPAYSISVFQSFKKKRENRFSSILFIRKKSRGREETKKTRKTSSCVNKHLCEFICIKWF